MSNPFSLVEFNSLKNLGIAILQHHNLNPADAETVINVLITADARGIPSHGMAHLKRHLADITAGLSNPNHKAILEKEKGAIAVINGNHSFGAVTSQMAMNKAINLAHKNGIGAVSVYNSSHHGISGYYASMALPHNMIGYAFTNTAALGAPTFGTQARFGTNPIAFAAPSGVLPPFVLDMSTTVVTRGAIEICSQTGQSVQEGWAVDSQGQTPTDAGLFLKQLINFEGGLLPLGGKGQKNGGHKGYGLAVMVDILCGLLSGGHYGINVHDTAESAACVSHFFMAIDISFFQSITSFKANMDTMLQTLLESKPISPLEKVTYAGLQAYYKEQQAKTQGVLLLKTVINQLNHLALHYKINPLMIIKEETND